MISTVTDALNWFNEFGGFSYVIPFLLIFAVVFAILDKTGILGDNKNLISIVGIAIGLLALQFDFVSEFFAVVFPRFGVGVSVFICALIFIGFFWSDEDKKKGKGRWIGYVVAIGIVVWAFSSWDQWGYYSGFGGWFSENIWALIILFGLVAIIFWVRGKEVSPPRGGATAEAH